MIFVTRIGRVFVKATRFLHPESVEVGSGGILHDRAFALAEVDDSFVSSARHGDVFPLIFDYDSGGDRLRLRMPNGVALDGEAGSLGRTWQFNLHGIRQIPVAEVEGPWADAISRFVGRPIRLVRCLRDVSCVDVMPITFVTTGSLRRLSRELGVDVDSARFRPGFVFDNDAEHEEDGWDGKLIRVGEATFRVRTPVPRCMIPGLHPADGQRDLDVMKGLIRYREKQAYPDGLLAGYETPGFASYAEIIEPGTVRVGDEVTLIS